MEVSVNSNCIGCGLCPNVCPGVFYMTDENVAQAVDVVRPRWKHRSTRPATAVPQTPLSLKKNKAKSPEIIGNSMISGDFPVGNGG